MSVAALVVVVMAVFVGVCADGSCLHWGVAVVVAVVGGCTGVVVDVVVEVTGGGLGGVRIVVDVNASMTVGVSNLVRLQCTGE